MYNKMDALWKPFQSLDVIGKRVLKSKMHKLVLPTTNFTCATPEKVKTK